LKRTQPVDFLLSIPAVDTLQRIWKQDYLPQDLGGTWKASEDRLEAARLFSSPYDLDAEASKKRSTYWIGDVRAFHPKPVMKTCPGSLHTLPQTSVPFQIERLFQLFTRPYNSRNCLPPKHIVDAGYVDAELLVASQTE
jgi:transposase